MNSADFNALMRKPAIAKANGVNLHDTGRAIKDGVKMEMDLHNEIIRHCDSQWPRWKYIRSRSDVPSSIQVGCQDFTIFAPGKVLLVECKSKTGKLDEAQRDWAHEMLRLGHTVHVIRSMEEFLKLI